MGCTAIASCPCGYDSGELFIGQGMTGPDPCHFPAYCKEGNHLVDVNMLDHPRRCPAGHKMEPVPYNAKSLNKEIGLKVVADWNWLDEKNHLVLTDGRYLCPACKQYTLAFREGTMMWD
jgi:hypothetical protein